MTAPSDTNTCESSRLVSAYAVHALPTAEAAAFEAHLALCPPCRRELQALGPVLDAVAEWATDVLLPPVSLQQRLAHRIAEETGGKLVPPPAPKWEEPDWERVAPGIFVKLLATDTEKRLVSMLVRLLPGAVYPPHTHAAIEELHLLDGELWIDGRKLYPGDYNCGQAGQRDERVWSETGCTCVLMTSTNDVLG